jgi:hypothetical protein
LNCPQKRIKADVCQEEDLKLIDLQKVGFNRQLDHT